MPAYVPVDPAVVPGIIDRLKRSGFAQRAIASTLGVAVSQVSRAATLRTAWGVDEAVAMAGEAGWDVVFGPLAERDGWRVVKVERHVASVDEVEEGNLMAKTAAKAIGRWLEAVPDGISQDEARALVPIVHALGEGCARLSRRLEAIAAATLPLSAKRGA